MAAYIMKRLSLLFLTLFVIMTLSYFVMSFVMMRRWEPRPPFGTSFVLVWQRYFEYLKLICTDWYWGTDRFGDDVWETLNSLMWRTMRLNIIAFLFYTTFGILLGTLSALYRKSVFDKAITVVILVLSSIPPYVLMIVFIILFSYRFPLFPPAMPPLTDTLVNRLQGFVMPVIVMSAVPLANITRIIRGELRELFLSDYLVLLKVKGLSRRQVATRHLIKDAAVSMMPELPSAILYALVGGFMVELIYGVRGVSAWLYHNIFQQFMDIHWVNIEVEPVTLVIIFYAFIALGFTVFIDIFYKVLDPRMSVISDDKNGNNNNIH